MFAFCCTAVAGGLSVEVGQTLGHYKLAWGCHAGAVRFCGMLSNCRSIRMSPKAGTSSAPLQESGALFDLAAVPDLPACLRPPRPLCLSAHGFVGVFYFVCVFCVFVCSPHRLFVCVRARVVVCLRMRYRPSVAERSLGSRWAVASSGAVSCGPTVDRACPWRPQLGYLVGLCLGSGSSLRWSEPQGGARKLP